MRPCAAARVCFATFRVPRRKHSDTKFRSGDGATQFKSGPMSQPHILLVEDDNEISALLTRYLRGNDCRVSAARDGREMDQVLATSRIDLIVLDLMLPGEDGLAICRRLRAASHVPIIIVTAKGGELDRIIGIEMGADDYLGKPFNPRELLARIRAVLRRTSSAAARTAHPGARALKFAGWTLDCGLRELHDPKGVLVAITGAEHDLLQALCERPGRVLSRDQLLDITQGRTAGAFERSVDILISRLRRKIEPDPAHPAFIKTIRSGGYMFTATVESA
jgi:two-component system OmpR family response regulator